MPFQRRGPAPVRRWADLEARAHLPEAQEEIRRAVRRGAIRVCPRPDGSLRIIAPWSAEVHSGPSRAPEPRGAPTDRHRIGINPAA